MDFYDVINSRRTIRDFTTEPIDMEIIKRVLSAGLKAPTHDHMRDWEFVVITDRKKIASVLEKIPVNVSKEFVENIIKSWELNDPCQQFGYRDAIPKQYEMLSKSACLILPFYKQKGDLFKLTKISSLNAFASVWCCIENIFLAATAEGLAATMRIPLDDESSHIAEILKHPQDYIMPCYIALGYAAPDAVVIPQNERNIKDKIHLNTWK
ncbi:MAG: nitroreductase family protein [Lachnospiraceae bacterium]|nr:nitroreductase family protein [Lachnospiraceae bacterium]